MSWPIFSSDDILWTNLAASSSCTVPPGEDGEGTAGDRPQKNQAPASTRTRTARARKNPLLALRFFIVCQLPGDDCLFYVEIVAVQNGDVRLFPFF